MQIILKRLGKCLHITYLVDSYSPIQCKVCPLVVYLTKPSTILNDKSTRLASGEIFWSVNPIHIQIIYSQKICTINQI